MKAQGAPSTISDYFIDLLVRYEALWVSLALIAYAVLAVLSSRHKPLWYDEIFSVIVATQPDWHHMAQAMPADGNPPLYALLARMSIAMFGISELSVRLPSLVAFSAALLGLYWFVRRAVGPVLALAALLLTLAEPGWRYSFEARPYALLLAFLMLGLVCWQSAAAAQQASPLRSRGPALLGIAIAIAGSILSHSIGIVEVGFPLVVGEAVRTWRRRRIDWPMLATALAALPALAITLPMLQRTNALVLRYSRRDVLASPLVSWYSVMSNKVLVALLLLAVFVWAARRMKNSVTMETGGKASPVSSSVRPYVMSAAVAVAALIPLIYLLTRLTTGYFLCRYGIGSIMGVSMIFVFILARAPRWRSTMSLILLMILTSTLGEQLLDEVRFPHPFVTLRAIDLEGLSDVPNVMADPFEYMRTWWYGSAVQKRQYFYLIDKQASIERGYVVVETAMVAEKPLVSLQLDDYQDFIQAHRHFRLCVTENSPTRFLKNNLEASGFHTTLLDRDGPFSLYDVMR